MIPNPRNPSRWRPAALCRTAERGLGRQSFKETILGVCFTRKDDWTRTIQVRLQGAISDLHAADGRYHQDCRIKSWHRARYNERHHLSEDAAFETVLGAMSSDWSHVWTSIELYNLYAAHGGTTLSRSTLIRALEDHFQGT